MNAATYCISPLIQTVEHPSFTATGGRFMLKIFDSRFQIPRVVKYVLFTNSTAIIVLNNKIKGDW